MLQTGTQMVSKDFRSATFASNEGEGALTFYTKFANAASPSYTWQDALPNSLEFMSQGKVAMIFNYAAAIPAIQARAPFLNVGVAPIPQPKAAKRPIAYPRYVGYTVSRQSRYADLAWEFIVTLATRQDVAREYLVKTKKPPALRALVNQYLGDPDLGVFARQALTARSWPQVDPEAIGRILSGAIESVLAGRESPKGALGRAQDQVSLLMSRSSF